MVRIKIPVCKYQNNDTQGEIQHSPYAFNNKREASPSIFADWVNGKLFLKPISKSLGKFG